MSNGIPVDITFASCFPSSCDASIVKNLTAEVTSDEIFSPALETVCPGKYEEYTSFDIAFLLVT